jgi:hypothetical protein
MVAIDDDGGRGHGGSCPQEQQRNEDQTFHDEPSISLLSSKLLHTIYYCRSDDDTRA